MATTEIQQMRISPRDDHHHYRGGGLGHLSYGLRVRGEGSRLQRGGSGHARKGVSRADGHELVDRFVIDAPPTLPQEFFNLPPLYWLPSYLRGAVLFGGIFGGIIENHIEIKLINHSVTNLFDRRHLFHLLICLFTSFLVC